MKRKKCPDCKIKLEVYHYDCPMCGGCEILRCPKCGKEFDMDTGEDL